MSELKIGEIDGTIIYKDEKGYFIFEHYQTNDKWYSLKSYLGINKEEVKQSLNDLLDWNYRFWHGESEEILNYNNMLDKIII